MSADDVGIVKRALAEFGRGNFWVPEFFAQDVRIKWLDAVGTESETVGLQEMSDFMKNWLATWDSLALVTEQVVDAGDEIVVISTWKGRGRASTVDAEWRHGAVWTVRNRRVASVISYRDPSDALLAAGLET